MTNQEFTLETSPEIRLSGCLVEDTKKHRRTLLVFCALCVALIDLQLLPQKIEILGVQVSEPNKERLLSYLMVIALFLLMSFVISVAADYLAWGIRKRVAQQQQFEDAVKLAEERRIFEMRHRAKWKNNTTASWMNAISDTRTIVDIAAPIVFSIYAILRMLGIVIPSIVIFSGVLFLLMAAVLCFVVRWNQKLFDSQELV